MASLAEHYVDIAKKVIELAKSAGDLRRWWQEEAEHREKYGLSDDQVQDLVKVCAARVSEIGDDSEDRTPAKRPQKQRRRLI